jgi:4-hydroxy-tetrahydrodipicolinate synthase
MVDLLKGSWVALVTPFDSSLKIDFAALEKLVKMHMEAETDGLLLCGTTGEAATMSFAEKAELIKFVRQKSENSVPIMFGTGSNDTAATVELSSKAKELGADAILVVTPYYNKPPQSGLIAHYEAVASSTDLPVVLYNVPGRTGCNMQAETTLKLAEVKNIVAVKEASGNLVQAMEILSKAKDDFVVFSGEDALNLPLMSCGALGTISVTANVAPVLMKKFNDAALSGDFVRARTVHYKLLQLHRDLFCETNPLPAKAALAARGMLSDFVRLPLSRPTDATRELIKKSIIDLE